MNCFHIRNTSNKHKGHAHAIVLTNSSCKQSFAEEEIRRKEDILMAGTRYSSI